jgi:hypothetical protein
LNSPVSTPDIGVAQERDGVQLCTLNEIQTWGWESRGRDATRLAVTGPRLRAPLGTSPSVLQAQWPG